MILRKHLSCDFLLLTAITLILILTNCQTPSPRPDPAPNPYLSYLLPYDPAILNKIVITNVDERFIGDIMRPTVAISNLTRNVIRLRYKFSWFDARGTEVRPNDEIWQQIQLTTFESRLLQATAPNSAVKSFKLSLQETR